MGLTSKIGHIMIPTQKSGFRLSTVAGLQHLFNKQIWILHSDLTIQKNQYFLILKKLNKTLKKKTQMSSSPRRVTCPYSSPILLSFTSGHTAVVHPSSLLSGSPLSTKQGGVFLWYSLQVAEAGEIAEEKSHVKSFSPVYFRF